MCFSGMFVVVIVLCLLISAVSLEDAIQESKAATCGRMSSSAGLIQGGYKTQRETFPWMANVFTKYLGATLYAGSGSLISDRHVLCAANSVAYENYFGDTLDLDPEQNYIAYDGENVKVILGTSMYKMTSEAGALSLDGTKKVVLHPSMTGTRPRVFNVALIFLKAPVAFSDFISPVCLLIPGLNIVGRTAYAVGYGVDSSGSISSMKKHVPMVVLDDPTCQTFFNETMQKGKASKFFCARGNGVDTPCRFDKPLYVKIGDRWFLQAMSSTFKVFKSKMCRPRAPVLYEDVTPFTNWIESEINQHNDD